MAEHLRKPKAKRFAYAKHGIESPFQPNWTQLFASGASDDEAKNASGAGEADEDDDEDDDSGVCVLRGDEYMQPFCFYAPSQADATTTKALEKIPVAVPTLVRVVLRVPGRGSLTPNAMVRRPTASEALTSRLMARSFARVNAVALANSRRPRVHLSATELARTGAHAWQTGRGTSV